MSRRIGCALVVAGLTAASPGPASSQPAGGETLKDMLAAQIRWQGFVCAKALDAKQEAQLSRPDHGVWLLTCSNATFRISRAPDMAAKVEQLP